MDLALSIFLYFMLFLVFYWTTQNFLRKIRNLPPSPLFVLPIIGHLFYLVKKPLHKKLHLLSQKKYGPVFTLQIGSRSVLIINSPSAAEELLTKTHDAIFANRPTLLAGKHLGYNYTNIAWAPYGDHWRNLRRISSIHLLSSHRLQLLSHICLDDVRTLLRHLSRQNPGNTVDMRCKIFEMIFNVLTRMILGKRFYGENAEISEEAKDFREIASELHRVAGSSGMYDFIPLVRWFSNADEKHLAVHERRDKFLQDLIKEIRSRNEDTGKTVIDVLLSLQRAEPDYYTDDIIKGLIAVLFQAGSDTTVATLEWAMSLLLNNPTVLEKVQAEIDSHVGTDRLIEESDIAELPYLNCVIKETLRLYPVLPLFLPHEPSEKSTVEGFHVPRGTMVLINAWAIHNNPAIWEDPLMFKPERFMGTGKREAFKYMPFARGRRGCPGEPLAMQMIGLSLGSLVQGFNWQRVSGELEDMSEGSGFLLIKRASLMAKCWPRPSLVNLLSQT